MADISKVKLPNNDVYDLKDTQARSTANNAYNLADSANTTANTQRIILFFITLNIIYFKNCFKSGWSP